ncbi:MAG: hypothetical protein K0B09_10340 [Bacteroidales bacterium]|nr:hypothetical protein [Bacteroidales bacterium]
MKTKLIITASLIFAASFMASASAPKRMLTFYDSMGRMLSQPVKAEVETEAFPFESQAAFKSLRSLEVNRSLDLTGITKPESEDTDIPFDLEYIFKQATK